MPSPAARSFALRWAACLALLLPVILLYVAECFRADGRSFTGFIQYDQPSYMADARAFFAGGFHLFYGNPFSPDSATPHIYFQPELLLLGLIQHVTGCDPGALYVLFGFCAGLACIRVAMALYEEVAGLRTWADWLGLVLFIWGGGVLALMGMVYEIATGQGGQGIDGVLQFDPAAGWWFLNLGRNLVYPTEAYYHALALGLLLTAMRRQFRAALAIAVLLSLSHPFTGLQFLFIATAWAGFESVILRNRTVPFLFAATMGCLVLVHLLYYVGLLDLFPEHRVVVAQWTIDWRLSLVTTIGADLLVGLLALAALRSKARELFSRPVNRLLATCFLVSFALSHHDWLISARQPIHFAHGYTWIALFLLGAGPLRKLLDSALSQTNLLLRFAIIGLILLVGLSDNLTWFGWQTRTAFTSGWTGIWSPGGPVALGPSERELFRWLQQRPQPHDEWLVDAVPDSALPYVATVYTDYRGWWTHMATTPYSAAHQSDITGFIRTGRIPPEWGSRSILLILPAHTTVTHPLPDKPIFANALYQVYLLHFRQGTSDFLDK